MIILDLALTRPQSCPELLCISKGCLFFKSYSNTTSWRTQPSSLELGHWFLCILAYLRSFCPSSPHLVFMDFLPDLCFPKCIKHREMASTRTLPQTYGNRNPGENPWFNKMSGARPTITDVTWESVVFAKHLLGTRDIYSIC